MAQQPGLHPLTFPLTLETHLAVQACLARRERLFNGEQDFIQDLQVWRASGDPESPRDVNTCLIDLDDEITTDTDPDTLGYYKTALHFSAGNNWCFAIEWLIANGADVNARTRGSEKGETALHLAAGSCYVEPPWFHNAVQVLLDAGAQIDALDDAGGSPLRWALKSQKYHVCRFLLSRGASFDVKPWNPHSEPYDSDDSDLRPPPPVGPAPDRASSSRTSARRAAGERTSTRPAPRFSRSAGSFRRSAASRRASPCTSSASSSTRAFPRKSSCKFSPSGNTSATTTSGGEPRTSSAWRAETSPAFPYVRWRSTLARGSFLAE